MEIPEELRIAIELAERSTRAGGRVATFAREMSRLLKRAETRLAAMGKLETVKTTEGLVVDGVQYFVNAKREMLEEHRVSGKSKPFRCSKGLYVAVASILATAERAMAVEEITAEVGKVMGEAVPDFQVRIPLRLWMAVDPPLVSRNRARYGRSDGTSFSTEATNLWTRLTPPKR